MPHGLDTQDHRVPPAYLAALHHRWLIDEPERRWRDEPGTLVFFDISGFTPLTERLATRGKIGGEELTDVLGAVFGELLAAAGTYGGDVLKFGGDAVLLHFAGDRHEVRACVAATEMQEVMRGTRKLRTSVGTVRLAASCGIASGPIHAFLVGSEFRELLVAGPTTTAALTMEAAAEAGEILLDPSTARALPASTLGEASDRGGHLLLRAPTAPPITASDRPASMPSVAGVQPSLAPYLAHGTEGEHRQGAVAFVQYRGVDAVLEEQGPDAAHAALDALIDAVQRACTRHQVTFVGTDCDRNAGKVMLTAGAPVGYPHDEDRLLLCLREILAHETPLHTRAGCNRGRIFAVHLGAPQRRTWTTMGETTNLAARVMGKAEPGEVLATQELLDRVTAPFALTPRPPLTLKGVAEPVAASVVGAVVEQTGSRRQWGTGRATPFVGRTAELAQLLDLVTSPEGSIVELAGPPGIGKSRLLSELEERALALGHDVVIVEGRPYGTDSAYGAVRGPLRELIAGSEPTDQRVQSALLDHLAEPSRRWASLVGIPFGLELPPSTEQRALTPTAARLRLRLELLPVLARIVPAGALLVIEDAHWLDEASANLLAAAVTAPGTRGLTAIISTREPVPDLQPDGMRRIELGPLEDAAVEALLHHDAEGQHPLAPAIAQALADRARGHPLFLEELISAARAGRDVNALPDTVEAMLVEHIDRLTPADRSVLRSAAVLGLGFDEEALAELVDLPLPEVRAALERLDDFIAPQGGGGWSFRQALARETAYEALPYRVRRTMHGRAAALLERMAGSEPGPSSPILSFHSDAAGDHDRSWRFSRMAAERAERQGAPVEASVFLRRALQAGKQIPELTPAALGDVALRLGDACELGGLYEEAEAAYRETARLVKHDPARRAEVCRKQGWLRERSGTYSQALRWYTRGLRELGEAGGLTATRLRGRLTLAYGAARLRQGKLEEAIEPLLEAARLAEHTEDSPSLAHASYLLDWAYTDLGRPVEHYRDQALRIYEELGDWTGLANVLNNLGVNAFFAGDWPGAIALYERSRQARERGGDVVRSGEALVNIGELLVDQGRLDEAEPRLKRALGLWRGAGFPVGVGVALMNLGRSAARRGDEERAAEYLARATETLDAIGSEQTIDVAVRESEFHLLAGRTAAAEDALEAARREALRRGGAPVLLAQIDRLRAAARAQAGELDEARALVAEARAAAEGTPYEEALCDDLAARLQLAAGESPHQVRWEGAHAVLRELDVARIWPPPFPGAAHTSAGVAIAAASPGLPQEGS